MCTKSDSAIADVQREGRQAAFLLWKHTLYLNLNIELKGLRSFYVWFAQVLPADLVEALSIIVSHCLQRDYLSVIDQYIKLVIAKAPPPVEDTMVAIQESSGKEETHMKSMAQMRKDEATKYLQSVKRLMTLCQRRYPWVPPKHAEFNSGAYRNGTQSLFTEQTRNHPAQKSQVRNDGNFPSGMKISASFTHRNGIRLDWEFSQNDVL